MNTNAAGTRISATAHSVWAVTDGRAGNEAQAVGLALALARHAPGEWAMEVKRITPRPPFQLLPPTLWATLGAREGGWPFSALEDHGAALARPWPDAVIGAGRRSAPIIAAMRRIAREQRETLIAAQILDPQMDPNAFDLVVAPEHDELNAPNAIATLGAVNRLTPERIAEEAALWRERLSHLPSPRVAVLLGGPSKSAFWRDEDVDRFCEQAAALAQDAGLMITPSRRTDPVVLAALAADCPKDRVWVWDGAGDNPYPGILGLADAVLVTEDSVNMASEAASTGLPVHVFRISGLDKKLRRFHESLNAHGAARSFEGRLERWEYEPLRETDRVARRLAELVSGAADAPGLGTGGAEA